MLTLTHLGQTISEEKISDHIKNNVNCKISITNFTTTIETDTYRHFYSDSFSTFKDFHFMRKVKQSCISNVHKLYTGDKETKYFDYTGLQSFDLPVGEIITREGNLNETDITAAYYYSAMNLGLITYELMTEIISNYQDRKKIKRLRILGNIASQKEVHEYKDGELTTPPYVISNKELRSAWQSICHDVDTTMIKCKQICGDDFLFYYVDGIYYDNSDGKSREIKHQMKLNGYTEAKEKSVIKVGLLNTGKRTLCCVKKSNGEKKIFTLPKKSVKYYYY